ncbi:MAG: hypothetical protein ACREP6_14985, partial [Candidatus Binataceae bacterium]
RENSIGFVVEPGNAAALADIIRRAADRRAELRAMGARARRIAEERFDRSVVTREFSALINQELGGNSAIPEGGKGCGPGSAAFG